MSEILPQLSAAKWKARGEQWISPSGVRYRSVVLRPAQGWDRHLQALLSQAILVARARAVGDERPLAVLVMRRATPLQDERLSTFAKDIAATDAWILCDQAGHFFPHIPGEPDLEASVVSSARVITPHRSENLFSDTNQWLIKVLLAASLPDRLLQAPRHPTRNASMLADLAKVSLPATSRFLTALDDAGHLDRQFGDLRVAQPLELLKKWVSRMKPGRHLGVRSVRGAGGGVPRMMVQFARVMGHVKIVQGLFEASAALGYRHAKGAAPLLYVQSFSTEVFDALGVVPDEGFDLMLSVPRYPRSVFNAAVVADGLPTTDIIQCWLDASQSRVRGEEQADYLWRKALVPLLGDK